MRRHPRADPDPGVEGFPEVPMSKTLEGLLRHAGLLTDRQLQKSVEQARRRNVPLIDVVLKDDNVPEDLLAEAFSTRLNIPRVRMATTPVEPDALKKVPEKLARKYTCLPLRLEGKTLVLAMADPSDYAAIQDVEFSASLKVRPVVATHSEIGDAVEEHYDPEDRIGTFLLNVPDVTDLRIMAPETQDIDLDEAHSRSAAEITPVIKMCNLLISDAIKCGASDLHIEPALNDVQVRVRVDGVLRDYTHLPKWLHNPLVSRLKIVAKLDIAERRLPQDGRVNVVYQGRALDLRVSTLPMNFGEKVVLRVLGGGTLPTLAKLGLTSSQTARLESAVAQPQGMILITGPTGSGKTTTLYAMLNHRRSPEVNIVTIEDPIEYQLPGINQVQINTRAGLTFAGVLRSILRQDPDVILVGETRDQETAEVAFQAAMTGHLVLSTLHTNSAIATITRLYDLGVDPNILATSLTLVVAQRLVRRICEHCREPITPDAATLERLGLGPADTMPMFRGRGCAACGQTGYSGRVGVYEFLKPTPTIRKLINDRAGEADLRKAAKQARLRLLRDDALDKVRSGVTSSEEVLRVIQIEDEEIPCPQCHALIQTTFASCPFCRYSLKTLCRGCGQELSVDWNACPYCNQSMLATTPREPAEEASEDAIPPPAPPPERAVRPSTALPEPSAPWYPGLQPVDFDLEPIATGKSETPDKPPTFAELGEVSLGAPAWVTPSPSAPSSRKAAPARSAPLPAIAEGAVVEPPAPAFELTHGVVEEVAVASPPGATEEIAAPGAAETAPLVVEAPAAIELPPPVIREPATPRDPSPATVSRPPKPMPVRLDEIEALLRDIETMTPSVPARAPGAPQVSPIVERAAPPIRPKPAAPVQPPAGPGETGVSAPRQEPGPDLVFTVPSKRLRILIVDDDEDIREVVRITLRRLPIAVDIETASDGVEALELANLRPPDLVILDIMMPRMNGFDTCQRLRQNLRTAFVPILMLTASADESSRTQGYLVGTDDYMSKPFLPIDLNMRITRLLRRTYGI
jgi:type IV pilus assembly protein PilB